LHKSNQTCHPLLNLQTTKRVSTPDSCPSSSISLAFILLPFLPPSVNNGHSGRLYWYRNGGRISSWCHHGVSKSLTFLDTCIHFYRSPYVFQDPFVKAITDDFKQPFSMSHLADMSSAMNERNYSNQLHLKYLRRNEVIIFSSHAK